MKEPNNLLDAPQLRAQAGPVSADQRQSSFSRRASRTPVPFSNGKTHSSAEACSALNGAPACPAGSALFPPQAWEQIARNLSLSGREFQIVRGTFDDQTESTIAAELHMAPSTVHTHIGRLHHKLAVTDRAQLLLRVMQEFLVLTASPENMLPPICGNRTAGRCPLRR